MTSYLLIPIKSLDHAKSRLAPFLTPEERKVLVIAMAKHVLKTITHTRLLSRVFVVTPDATIAQVAKTVNAKVLIGKAVGYNQSLRQAVKQLPIQPKDVLIILPADLPLLTQNDVEQLIQLSKQYDVVLALAKDGGTNALATTSRSLPFLFGPNSFMKYAEYARKNHFTLGTYSSESIAFDIDTIADLKVLRKQTK